MNTRRLRIHTGGAVAVVALASVLLSGCCFLAHLFGPDLTPNEVVIEPANRQAAYDALTRVLLTRFEALDMSQCAAGERAVTTWREEPEETRLTRRRAVARVNWSESCDEARVEVRVQLETSTRKTSFGALDKKNPEWVGKDITFDTELERRLLTQLAKVF